MQEVQRSILDWHFLHVKLAVCSRVDVKKLRLTICARLALYTYILLASRDEKYNIVLDIILPVLLGEQFLACLPNIDSRRLLQTELRLHSLEDKRTDRCRSHWIS
jgi:hypothetical protein